MNLRKIFPRGHISRKKNYVCEIYMYDINKIIPTPIQYGSMNERVLLTIEISFVISDVGNNKSNKKDC